MTRWASSAPSKASATRSPERPHSTEVHMYDDIGKLVLRLTLGLGESIRFPGSMGLGVVPMSPWMMELRP